MVNVGKSTVRPMYGSEFVEFLMNFAQIWETTQVLKGTNIEMNVRDVR